MVTLTSRKVLLLGILGLTTMLALLPFVIGGHPWDTKIAQQGNFYEDAAWLAKFGLNASMISADLNVEEVGTKDWCALLEEAIAKKFCYLSSDKNACAKETIAGLSKVNCSSLNEESFREVLRLVGTCGANQLGGYRLGAFELKWSEMGCPNDPVSASLVEQCGSILGNTSGLIRRDPRDPACNPNQTPEEREAFLDDFCRSECKSYDNCGTVDTAGQYGSGVASINFGYTTYGLTDLWDACKGRRVSDKMRDLSGAERDAFCATGCYMDDHYFNGTKVTPTERCYLDAENEPMFQAVCHNDHSKCPRSNCFSDDPKTGCENIRTMNDWIDPAKRQDAAQCCKEGHGQEQDCANLLTQEEMKDRQDKIHDYQCWSIENGNPGIQGTTIDDNITALRKECEKCSETAVCKTLSETGAPDQAWIDHYCAQVAPANLQYYAICKGYIGTTGTGWIPPTPLPGITPVPNLTPVPSSSPTSTPADPIGPSSSASPTNSPSPTPLPGITPVPSLTPVPSSSPTSTPADPIGPSSSASPTNSPSPTPTIEASSPTASGSILLTETQLGKDIWAEMDTTQPIPQWIPVLTAPIGEQPSPLPTASWTCGNKTVEPGEQCDDGNTLSGDGCSELCRIEKTSGSQEEQGWLWGTIEAIADGIMRAGASLIDAGKWLGAKLF